MKTFTAGVLSAILALGSVSAAPTTKRDFNPPGFSNPLPGAAVSFTCTQAAPCGVADDPGAAATYYTVKDPASGVEGITACGYNDPNNQYTDKKLNDDTDDFIALAAGMMGSLSTGQTVNPVCGQNITVTNTLTGTTITAPVVDKCPGCVSQSFWS